MKPGWIIRGRGEGEATGRVTVASCSPARKYCTEIRADRYESLINHVYQRATDFSFPPFNEVFFSFLVDNAAASNE